MLRVPCTVGGPRDISLRYQDAMAIVREKTRAPSYFITMTCNPRWPEIAGVHTLRAACDNLVKYMPKDSVALSTSLSAPGACVCNACAHWLSEPPFLAKGCEGCSGRAHTLGTLQVGTG